MLLAMCAHGLLLVGQHAHIRAGKRTAQEHEARRLILGKNAAGFGLIYLALKQPAGAIGTPALQAHVRQVQTGPRRDIEQVFISLRLRPDLLSLGRHKGDLKTQGL